MVDVNKFIVLDLLLRFRWILDKLLGFSAL